MNRCPCVALAWIGLVCLLLALAHQDAVASLNSHPRIACCGRTVDPLRRTRASLAHRCAACQFRSK